MFIEKASGNIPTFAYSHINGVGYSYVYGLSLYYTLFVLYNSTSEFKIFALKGLINDPG